MEVECVRLHLTEYDSEAGTYISTTSCATSCEAHCSVNPSEHLKCGHLANYWQETTVHKALCTHSHLLYVTLSPLFYNHTSLAVNLYNRIHSLLLLHLFRLHLISLLHLSLPEMRPLLNQRSSLVRVLLCFQSRMNFSPATKTHFGSPLVHRRIWVGDGKNQNSRQHDLSYFCLSKLGIHVDWISSCGPHNKANVSSQHSGMCSFTRASQMRPLLYFQSSGALPLNVYHTFRFLCDACHASSCFLSMMSCSSRLL